MSPNVAGRSAVSVSTDHPSCTIDRTTRATSAVDWNRTSRARPSLSGPPNTATGGPEDSGFPERTGCSDRWATKAGVGARGQPGEDRIDEGQDPGHRAEVRGQLQALVHLGHGRLEFGDVGAPEPVDGLLGVPDHEEARHLVVLARAVPE